VSGDLHSFLSMSFLLPVLPDPALRQPATLAAITPVILSVYAQAVLAILPNTFILKLALLPFIVWQTWSCVVGLDVSAAVAKWSGLQSDDRLRFWNVSFAVCAKSFHRAVILRLRAIDSDVKHGVKVI
jgi:hypothetical protein